jgi:hypothetical protein
MRQVLLPNLLVLVLHFQQRPPATTNTPLTVGDWAAIGTAIGTFLLAIVAAFQDKIRAWLMRPDLQMSVRVAAPECQKTHAHFHGPAGIPDQAPCYYFRVMIENIGRTEARQVEVFAAGLSRRRADGTFERVDRFNPMNLVWAHFRQPFLAVLSPRIPKMCDLAHIFHPNFKDYFGHALPGVAGIVLAFDLQVEPNTKGHLVGPGTYNLKLMVGAANAKPKEYNVEINFQGQWYDDETEMLRDGFGLRII